MADPFVAEIRIFPFNFAPKGWAWCDGQLLPLSQNTALFALLGTFYGGDGRSTFALPNLMGSVPIHQGNGFTGTQYFLGQEGGSPYVTLLESQIPNHTHRVQASNFNGDIQAPQPAVALARSHGGSAYQDNATQNLTTMDPNALAPAGSSFPHNNLMPFLTLYFNIAMQGVFPPRP